MNRRDFSKNLGLAGTALGLGFTTGCQTSENKEEKGMKGETIDLTGLPVQEMYDKALEITKSKVRGGDSETFFKKPFIDAAFSDNIFLWDTCFMVCFCKHHLDELPVAQALDNFYDRIEEDGYICREYRKDGRPLWSKDHPVSINPPLLAFAELELYSTLKDKNRLAKVYPILKKNFEFHVNNYQGEDKLFFGDTLGMGMDNIPRYPKGWDNDGIGLTHHELGEKVKNLNGTGEDKLNFFIAEYVKSLSGLWNKQGRLVDFSAQMAMFAKQLIEIATIVNQKADIPQLEAFHKEVKEAVNTLCWDENDKTYYDLANGKPIKRKHIGMYWTLLGELVPEDRVNDFLKHLVTEDEFYRKMPLPALSADDPDYKGWGDYWLGGVWAPTSYMVLKGLMKYDEPELAKDLAFKTYKNVAEVFEATGTFWENYAPDLVSYGMPAKYDFCGWTGLIPIAFYKEFLS